MRQQVLRQLKAAYESCSIRPLSTLVRDSRPVACGLLSRQPATGFSRPSLVVPSVQFTVSIIIVSSNCNPCSKRDFSSFNRGRKVFFARGCANRREKFESFLCEFSHASPVVAARAQNRHNSHHETSIYIYHPTTSAGFFCSCEFIR